MFFLLICILQYWLSIKYQGISIRTYITWAFALFALHDASHWCGNLTLAARVSSFWFGSIGHVWSHCFRHHLFAHVWQPFPVCRSIYSSWWRVIATVDTCAPTNTRNISAAHEKKWGISLASIAIGPFLNIDLHSLWHWLTFIPATLKPSSLLYPSVSALCLFCMCACVSLSLTLSLSLSLSLSHSSPWLFSCISLTVNCQDGGGGGELILYYFCFVSFHLHCPV